MGDFFCFDFSLIRKLVFQKYINGFLLYIKTSGEHFRLLNECVVVFVAS